MGVRSKLGSAGRSFVLLCALGTPLAAAAAPPDAPAPVAAPPAAAPLPAQAAAEVQGDPDCDPFFEECAGSQERAAPFPDPLEPGNRVMLEINRGIDWAILDPITKIYGLVLPEPVKQSVRRVFLNLDSPAIAVNDALQLEWDDALSTLSRFLVNSTLGIGGLFDPAARVGLEPHHSDFGQTLALAGVPSGPYLILPVLGPTTARDGFGVLIDTAMSPLLYVLGPLSFEQIYLGGGSGLSLREAKLREIEALEASSIDFYAALRSAYSQNRLAEIWGRREHRRPQGPGTPPR